MRTAYVCLFRAGDKLQKCTRCRDKIQPCVGAKTPLGPPYVSNEAPLEPLPDAAVKNASPTASKRKKKAKSPEGLDLGGTEEELGERPQKRE